MATGTSRTFLDYPRRSSATCNVQASAVLSPIGQSNATSSSFSSTSKKKPCTCSPTTHPGSFRCSLHRSRQQVAHSPSPGKSNAVRESTMENGREIVKRALAAMIRSSSHQLRRREGFKQRPSRLSSVVSV